VIAGRFGDVAPLAPPPDSWAAQAESDVAIWTLRMEPGAMFQLPPATLAGTKRTLYFFKGEAATIAGQLVQGPASIALEADVEVAIAAGNEVTEFLLLQGRPIAEPVAQYGPFVMNTQAEIMQAMQDYRRTQFGGWSFADTAPVHGSEPRRFAKYPDGREETPAASR
jgi:redox-sensitive bicupin YhaK (pirin superfamily)